MSALIIFALTTLVFIAIYQIAKATEHASILKGKEGEQYISTNKLMAWLMLVVFILGMWGLYECHYDMMELMLPTSIPASDHGEKYESMLEWTVYITGSVFLVTQALLFIFIFKYKDTGKRKAFFFPHNNNLEIFWTVIPAIVLVILVVIGLRNWVNMTGDAPQESTVVEITGKQFNWIIRYPGADGVFGKTDFRKINDANNPLGLVWDDPASKDDIIVQNGQMRLVVNKPVKLVIRSRDVIHNVGLPHFRMKMDAVPGIITSMWFTPKYTSAEMAKLTKQSDFEYEITCDQMCGKGHYSMRGTVVVETQQEYDNWMKEQKSYYIAESGLVKPEDVPAAPVTDSVPTTDTNATAQAVVKK